jgi:hypothetical protein
MFLPELGPALRRAVWEAYSVVVGLAGLASARLGMAASLARHDIPRAHGCERRARNEHAMPERAIWRWRPPWAQVARQILLGLEAYVDQAVAWLVGEMWDVGPHVRRSGCDAVDNCMGRQSMGCPSIFFVSW